VPADALWRVRDLVDAYRPWPYPYRTPHETWDQLDGRLWDDDRYQMAGLFEDVIRHGWPGGPVIVHGSYVQDGHHRLTIARDVRPHIVVPVRPLADAWAHNPTERDRLLAELRAFRAS